MLTELKVRNLKPKAERYEVWDEKLPAFGVRVFPSGGKSFVVFYRTGGRLKRKTLGKYPIISLSEARTEATRILRDITLGLDPSPTRKSLSTSNFSEVVSSFMRLHCKEHNRATTIVSTEHLLRKHFESVWASRPITDITKKDVLDVLDGILAKGHSSSANHAFGAIRKLFNWCVARGHLETSPCVGIARPAKSVSRDRVLTDDELRAIMKGANELGYPFGNIVMLLLMTAQRRNEISALQWDHIDTHNRTITLPAQLAKNGHQHTFPYGETAARLLDTIPRFESPFLFPARGKPDRSYNGWSKGKARLNQLSGIEDWTLHDLRRSTSTVIASMGIAPHVVEKLLNHRTGTLGGVTGIYLRYEYMDEMREAIAAWDDKLSCLMDDCSLT